MVWNYSLPEYVVIDGDSANQPQWEDGKKTEIERRASNMAEMEGQDEAG